MNARKEDNLRELFERFVGTEEAERCIEDIIKAERILDENPAPGPGEDLIAAVNNRIAEELRLRKEHTFRRFAYKLAPVAAVFIVLAAVGIQMLFREGGGPVEPGREYRGPIISARVWNSEDVAADDRNLVVLTTELDELEVEFATLESEENGAGSSSAVTELEIEFAEINGNIWEG